ncbi:hypothetical protein [Thiocapsa rosea]|uniref:hypothetical protein n=1 Tax=Thiocapsa rosea TaxID=69360 RepID=UPI000EADF715|nr:hypothetical protein [Thiocapsa rosea]
MVEIATTLRFSGRLLARTHLDDARDTSLSRSISSALSVRADIGPMEGGEADERHLRRST